MKNMSAETNKASGTKIYFAPLEGITGFAYRNTHQSLFSGVDKYFTPFVAPNYTHHMKTREREDIAPRNNEGVRLVPQILTNRAEDFLWAAGEIYAMGYREINLNLGCPMPTVVKKHRGSGQLGDPDELDRFLEEICAGMDRQFGLIQDQDTRDPRPSEADRADRAGCPGADPGPASHGPAAGETGPARDGLRFSIKTRIGMESSARAGDLLEIYNRYPLQELIVHPRTQRDLYGGSPDLEIFAMFLEGSVNPVVYNGDIFTGEDFAHWKDRFPSCGPVMIGRGMIADPALAREITGGAALTKEELRRFHDAVFTALRDTLPGQAPLIGKMKELWFYMGRNFEDADRYLKEIRKAGDLVRYAAAVRTLFAQCPFREK